MFGCRVLGLLDQEAEAGQFRAHQAAGAPPTAQLVKLVGGSGLFALGAKEGDVGIAFVVWIMLDPFDSAKAGFFHQLLSIPRHFFVVD